MFSYLFPAMANIENGICNSPKMVLMATQVASCHLQGLMGSIIPHPYNTSMRPKCFPLYCWEALLHVTGFVLIIELLAGFCFLTACGGPKQLPPALTVIRITRKIFVNTNVSASPPRNSGLIRVGPGH